MNDHPSLESLLDLTLDNLPEHEAFALREHLIDCHDCREQLQDLLEVPDAPPEGHAALSEAEKQRSWAQVSERLDAEDYKVGDHSEAPGPENQDTASENFDGDATRERADVLPFSTPRRPMLLAGTTAAAVALVFTTGLLIGRRDMPESVTRVAAWTSVTGEPGTMRGSSMETAAGCPSPEGHFVWDLSLATVESVDRSQLRVEITLPNGTTEILESVQPDNYARILLTRAQEITPNGTYVIRVFEDNKADALETFHLVVSCD